MRIALALLTVTFALALGRFVWQPSLASFADDSASYLVMAQVFSPWQAASLPVREAFAAEAFYPPLFPLLLALTGTSHDVALAHLMAAFLLAACVPLFFVLARRRLGGPHAAFAATAVLLLLPSLWINAKGILSEPLFMLVLLAALLVIEDERPGRRRLVVLSLLFAALALTRTIGLAMAAGYALCALIEPGRRLRERAGDLLPAGVALAAYAGWMLVRPSATADVNIHLAAEFGRSYVGPDALAVLAARVATQAHAMAEAWLGALMLFWVEGRMVPVFLAGIAGTAALAGLARRLYARRADAWMLAAYLGVLLLWPFPGQMSRFLFPVVPLLLLYAFEAAGQALRLAGRPPALSTGVLALVFAVLAVPPLAFIRERARIGAEEGLAQMTDWYRTPDLAQAEERARVHLDLLADMQAIRDHTREGARVMWVTPAYVALLAGRHGVAAPPLQAAAHLYLEAVELSRPEYVFLSTYHPRNTTSDAAWRNGLQALRWSGEPVHTRSRGGRVTSVLLRMGGQERKQSAAARPASIEGSL